MRTLPDHRPDILGDQAVPELEECSDGEYEHDDDDDPDPPHVVADPRGPAVAVHA
jgi:hypothetical protein